MEVLQIEQLKAVTHESYAENRDLYDVSILIMSSYQIKVFCVKNTDYAVDAWGATVESTRASRGGFGG